MKRKEINNYKKTLFDKQNKRCALTGIEITDVNKAHLDHDHALDGSQAGRCRGLLLAQANVLEGGLKHQFMYSGLAKHIEYIDFLKRLVTYLEKDNSKNPIHPQLVTDLSKRFSKMTLKQMKETLLAEDINPVGDKKSLINLYKQNLKVKYD
ncbi:TPA: endonuclease domain-containing protein [Escherichia coli]